jgi:hypothetical protein
MEKERDIMKERWKETSQLLHRNTNMVCSNKIYGETEKERNTYYERETERQTERERESEEKREIVKEKHTNKKYGW